MADLHATSVIQTYGRRLNYMPYFCSTTFGCATLGANGIPNKLFLAFLFSDVGVHFLKYVGLFRSSMVYCKCGGQISWCFDINGKDGYRWRSQRITSTSACSASTSIRHVSWFQQRISLMFCSWTKSFAHTAMIESTWRYVLAFLNSYNRIRDYIYYLAHYMFATWCRSDNVDQFTKSNGIVATMYWSATPFPISVT